MLQLYLNSDLATTKVNSTANSSMIFYIKDPIVPPDGHQLTVRVTNLAVPTSFYLVNSSNNKIVINSTTYTIANGNYTAYSFLDALNSTLGGSFTVTFSTITNKFTFSTLTNFTLSQNSTCQKLIGFASGVDYVSSSSALTSVYPIDLSGDNMLYLAVNNLKFENLLGGTQTSILKAIPVNVSQGSVLFYDDNGTGGTFKVHEDHVGFVHLMLYGEDATTLIDLQNVRWSVTLEFDYVPMIQNTVTRPRTIEGVYQEYLKSIL